MKRRAEKHKYLTYRQTSFKEWKRTSEWLRDWRNIRWIKRMTHKANRYVFGGKLRANYRARAKIKVSKPTGNPLTF